MTNTNMRKGFTMIELIFVIVIIGILAAVAIPKLAANRDDATASTCVHEVGQLVNELSSQYTQLGNSAFTSAKIGDMTNIAVGVTGNDKGITNAATANVGSTAIAYTCDGTVIANITGANAGTDYNLTVAIPAAATADSPAATNAKAATAKNIGTTPGNSKIFTL